LSRRRDSLYRRDKSKTLLRDRFDVTWSLCVIAQRLPKFPESGAKTLVKIDEGIGRPQLAAEFLAADHFSGPVQQHEKNLSGLSLQSNAHSLLAQLPRGGVHFKDSETEDARRLCQFWQGHSLVLKGFKV
jgi:hypothetical protein